MRRFGYGVLPTLLLFGGLALGVLATGTYYENRDAWRTQTVGMQDQEIFVIGLDRSAKHPWQMVEYGDHWHVVRFRHDLDYWRLTDRLATDSKDSSKDVPPD